MTTQESILEARCQIGARLRRLREEAGSTRDEIARELGVTWKTIVKLETGRWAFSIDLVIGYANIFNLKIVLL